MISPLVSAADVEGQEIREFYASIRARSLYGVGEELAYRELSRVLLSDRDRTEYTTELAITLLQHGMLESGAVREDLWELAETTLSDQLEIVKDQSLKESLAVWQVCQQAQKNVYLAQEEFFQPIASDELARREEALVDSIKTLGIQLQRLPVRDATSPKNTAEHPFQTLLRQQVQLEILHCEFWVIVCQKALNKDDEQTVKLIENIEFILSNALSPQIEFRSRLLRARLASELGDQRSMTTFVRESDLNHRADSEQEAFFTERLRFELVTQRFDELFKQLDLRLKTSKTINDEGALLVLQALLRMVDQAATKGQAEKVELYSRHAQEMLNSIRGYWSKTAESILIYETEKRELGAELATLKRQTDTEIEDQHFIAATQSAQASVPLFLERGLLEQAFEYGKIAVSGLIQNQDYLAAQALIDQLQVRLNEPAQLSQLDLMRSYIRLQQNDAGVIGELQQLIENYPDFPSAEEARLMLGSEYFRTGQFAEGIAVLAQISNESRYRENADRAVIATISHSLKSELQSPTSAFAYSPSGSPAESLNQASSGTEPEVLPKSQFNQIAQEVIQRLSNDDATWSLERSSLLLDCVELLMRTDFSQDLGNLQAQQSAGFPLALTQAESLLNRLEPHLQSLISSHEESVLMHQIENPAVKLEQRFQSLRFQLLTKQGRFKEAADLLANFSQSPELLLNLILEIQQQDTEASLLGDSQRGELQLKMIVPLLADLERFPQPTREKLLIAHAHALLLAGNLKQAIQIYETLIRQNPASQQVQSLLLKSLHLEGSPSAFKRALEILKSQENQLQRGTDEWIACRVEQAKVLSQSGDKTSARKLLSVTRTLYPNAGTPEVRKAADSLIQQLGE